MNKVKLTSAGLVAVMFLSGCASTPMGPTVRATPPAGKPYEVFQSENAYCKDQAKSEVAGEADSANGRAVGGALLGAALGAGLGAAVGGGHGAGVGAAVGGTAGTAVGAGESSRSEHSIQFQYDSAYSACMSAKGNLVAQPVTHHTVTVVQPVQPVYAPPPVVYTAPPLPPGYAPPAGYAPPPGAVAPPANMPPPQ